MFIVLTESQFLPSNMHKFICLLSKQVAIDQGAALYTFSSKMTSSVPGH